MRQHYHGEKPLFTFLLVVGLAVLLGGCVGIKDRLVSSETTGRLAPLSDQIKIDPPGNNSSLLACDLREVSPKEAGIDPDALWEDTQIATLREQLERRGLKPILGAMRLFASQYVQFGFMPFSAEAGIAFEERAGQLSAVALVKQEDRTLNIYPDGREELWALLSKQAVQGLVEQLRRDEAFLAFERGLASQGKQINPAQSVGAITVDKGLLYLAVIESLGLTLKPTVSYHRMELRVSEKETYRMQRAPLEICATSKDDMRALGFPEGAIMDLVGVYEASSENELEIQVVRPPRDPCVLGLGALTCLDTQRWLPRLIEEKSEQSNTTTLESFNWALRQEGVEGGVLYVEYVEKATKLLLAGYRDLAQEQIETLLKAANALQDSVPQSLGPFSPTCTEQQPTPAQLINEAVQFLESIGVAGVYTRDNWRRASIDIGLSGVLPKVGEFSGQDWFNYQVALFILAVKEAYETRDYNSNSLVSLDSVRNTLGSRVGYVLNEIRKAALLFMNPDPNGTLSPTQREQIRAQAKARVEAWLDKIMVAARTHSICGPHGKWFLLDFLRVVDTNGHEQRWPSYTTSTPPDTPPSGQIIDVIVLWLKQDPSKPPEHRNDTLLAFLKVDSSRPDGGHFNDPIGQSLEPTKKAEQMIRWLDAVYKHITQNAVPGAVFYWHGMKIVGWIFTNPQNPAMMQQLVTAIINEASRRNFQFSHPFFIAYTADGQPEVVCFGCSTQAEIWAAWMTACQRGGICAPNVQVVRSDGGQGPANMLFPTPGDPNETGTVTPSTGSLFFDMMMADGGGGGGEPSDPCNQN